jgi:LPS-assembly protein
MGPSRTPFFFLACLSLLAGVFALPAGEALAAETPGLGLGRPQSPETRTYVEADEIEYQDQKRLIFGRGNVMIRFGDRILHADAVRVDLASQEFLATGNVLLVEGPSRMEGSRLEYNYGTNLGVMYDARVFLYPSTSFRGIEVRKTGEGTYRIHQGAYTTCSVCLSETDPRSWEVRAVDATAVRDESFTAWHASAWAADALPFWYFPFVQLPLGPRRSGFLTPRPGNSSTHGFVISQPFYWAISESQDATFTGIYRTKTGWELDGEYRYILSPYAYGLWRGAFIRDRQVPQDQRNRWEIHGTHTQLFTPTLSLKADLNFQSDESIGRTFADRSVAERTQRVIQANAFVTQAGEAYNAMLWADVSRDLVQALDTRLIRLPQLSAWLFDRPIFSLPLTLGAAGSAAFFERKDFPDAVRADFGPRLRLPWSPVPWLNFTGTGGARGTIYSVANSGFSGTPVRTLYDAGLAAESRLRRTFDVGWGNLQQVTHVVVPRVQYLYTPYVNQQEFPQFDQDDFVSPQNRLIYGLENRFLARLRDAEGNVATREVLRLSVAQSYDLRPRTRVYSNYYLTALTPERVDNAVRNVQPILGPSGSATDFSQAQEQQFSNLVLSGQIVPHPNLFLGGAYGYDTAAGKMAVADLQVRLTYPGWGNIGLSYTNQPGQKLQGLTGSLGISPIPGLTVNYLARVNTQTGLSLENNVFARYSTCCWDLTFRFINRFVGVGQPNENAFRVSFEFKTGRGVRLQAPSPSDGGAPPSPNPPTGGAPTGSTGRPPVDGPATGQ